MEAMSEQTEALSRRVATGGLGPHMFGRPSKIICVLLKCVRIPRTAINAMTPI